MNRFLTILAAGVLAVSPLTAAVAMEHGDAEPAMEAMTEDSGMAAVAHEYTLEGGAVLYVEDGMAFVMDAEGNKVAAPDGEHKLEDGTVFEVMDGKATGLPEVMEDTMTHEGEDAPAEE